MNDILVMKAGMFDLIGQGILAGAQVAELAPLVQENAQLKQKIAELEAALAKTEQPS